MGCTEGLAKILVFVVNFCFLLVGLALLVAGILVKVNYSKFTEAVPSDYDVIQYIPIISMVVGAIIFFIAFLGCCGTLKSNRCMLNSYGGILFIIFLLQVGLGIFALVTIKDNTDLQSKLTDAIKKLFDRYYASTKSSKETVDLIQDAFQCCGVDGRTYWDRVPASCPTDNDAPGCSKAIYDYIMNSAKLIGIVALTVSVVEVVGAVLALCLSNCIRRREVQGAYY